MCIRDRLEAGFFQIDATPDSASPRLLKNLGKGFTLTNIEKMAMLVRKFNMPTMWFFLFGGPGEDEETVLETFDFIDKFINPDDLVYMNAGLRIYPNTPLYSIAVDEARIVAGESVFQPPAYYFSEKITKMRLDQMMKEASSLYPNCISSTETAPTPDMIREALVMRKNQHFEEPMFRTLLRIRKSWRMEGKI